MKRVEDVVRLGRVQHVGSDEIRLDRGTVSVAADTLFVDCSANGLAKVDPRPLFSEGRVTLQPVFMCQQTFSAALIAHLALLDISDDRRNQICTPVPHPEQVQDLASTLVVSAQNMLKCNRYLALWLRRSRLYLGHHSSPLRYVLSSGKLAMIQRRAATSMNEMQQKASAEQVRAA